MFSLNDSQLEKLKEWQNNHKIINKGAIGGRYTYCFTPTSLGVIIIIKSIIDNDEIDLTCYEEW
jgi:hypothetical protein